MGIEFKRDACTAWILEAGYAFGRHLEYQSAVGNYYPVPDRRRKGRPDVLIRFFPPRINVPIS